MLVTESDIYRKLNCPTKGPYNIMSILYKWYSQSTEMSCKWKVGYQTVHILHGIPSIWGQGEYHRDNIPHTKHYKEKNYMYFHKF